MAVYLNYSATELLQKRKRLRRELSAQSGLQAIRIAVLGGTTTSEVVDILEILLLASGFAPTFYQGEYGRYYEDATLDPQTIKDFGPDLIYIHTHYRDVRNRPTPSSSLAQVQELLQAELERFREIWSTLHSVVGCQIIQNNFETPPLRSLGSFDAVTHSGFSRFLLALNLEFARAAALERRLLINDLHALAATLGLTQWFDWNRWYSYKLVTTPDGSALIAKSLNAIVGAIRGKSKKCLILDLDNTLWGGVIGDDGVDKILIGRETAEAEAYTAFQAYCLSLRERGVLLAVASKNNEETAKSGFSHPDSVLKLEHFSAFHANWNPKHESIAAIATELNLGLDSFVFVDDNPAERSIVSAQLPSVSVPDVGSEVSLFPSILQGEHFFEVASLSQEDLERAKKYSENTARTTLQAKFANYGEYLQSLAMTAEIDSFRPIYLDRIAQLINKSNQFNLTTRRYTYAEIEQISQNSEHIGIYGRLSDVFGDNGLVSVIIGRIAGEGLQVDLWIMSCRVLKRDMELAMLDALVERAQRAGIYRIVGVYKPSAKNSMVKDHYQTLGFTLVDAADDGASIWSLDVSTYTPRNKYIQLPGSAVAVESHENLVDAGRTT